MAVHFGKECRGMLEIGVHYDNVIALCVLKACVHSRFLAEVTREGNVSYTLVLIRKLTENFECAVL